MSKPTLVIGNKCYSSWSLRGWLPLRHWQVPFEEHLLWFADGSFDAEVAKHSPTRRVPVLIDGDTTVWDSLAICEYVNERWLDGKGWPADRAARAMARSICAEMHTGFTGLRSSMPMDCRASGMPVAVNQATRADVARMRALLAECRARHGASSGKSGPYLFGEFSLADCYFAPVVIRFKGYGVKTDAVVSAWLEQMWQLPALAEWIAAGRVESETVPPDILAIP